MNLSEKLRNSVFEKYIYREQGRQFVLKSGGDKRSDEKTLQQDGKNIE